MERPSGGWPPRGSSDAPLYPASPPLAPPPDPDLGLRPIKVEAPSQWHKWWLLAAGGLVVALVVSSVASKVGGDLSTASRLENVDSQIVHSIQSGDLTQARALTCGVLHDAVEAMQPSAGGGTSEATMQVIQAYGVPIRWKSFSIAGQLATATGTPTGPGANLSGSPVARGLEIRRTFQKVGGQWEECDAERVPH